MKACYRTCAYGTAIQGVLRGSLFEHDNLDVVLVKNYSLQYIRIQKQPSTATTAASFGDNNDILQPVFEQQAFGTILDAKRLACRFEEEKDFTTRDSIDEHNNESKEQDEETVPYTQKTRTGHTRIQGKDMLVLLSEYGQLVFCTLAGQTANMAATGRFECVAEIMLDKPGLEYTKINKKLAIDPHSRAIAVASYQDRIDIMILKDCMSSTHFMPVEGMGSIVEEGIIWHMEFLHTETSSRDRILLAVIVYNDLDRVCRIIVYSIDGSKPEKASIKLVGRLPLDKKTPLPVLLSPLQCYPESFMIITERTVCVLSADDIACGNVLYPVTYTKEAMSTVDVHQDLMVTAHSFSDDPTLPMVYVGTAEGYLFQLDLSDLGAIKWHFVQKCHSFGQHMCTLGVIALIEDDDKTTQTIAEVLFYTGESADGQVLAVKWSKNDDNEGIATCHVMQTVLNRAPLTDWQAIRQSGMPDKIVACSGQDEQGALHYVSYDCDTTTLYESEPDWLGITKLWGFWESWNRTFLVGSSSYDTRLVFVDSENRMNEDTVASIETNRFTLYADDVILPSGDNALLQVSQDSLLFSSVNGDIQHYLPSPQGHSIVAATAWEAGEDLYLSLCLSDGENYTVRIYTLEQEEGEPLSPLTLSPRGETSLQSAPSCFYRFKTDVIVDEDNDYVASSTPKAFSILAVGTFDASVIFYLYDMHFESLTYLNAQDCDDIPHSLATVGQYPQHVLLVGGRTGHLMPIEFKLNGMFDMICTCGDTRRLGLRPVALSVGAESKKVFAQCDGIWMIDEALNVDIIHLPADLTTIEAAVTLPPIGMPPYAQKLAVVADQRLYIFSLQTEARLSTRKLTLASTPRKILVHDHSTSYLVTSSKHRGKIYYQLKLINQSGDVLCEHQFDEGETVLSLSKWQVENKSKTYHYICVGIEHQEHHHHHSQDQRNRRSSVAKVGSLHLYRLKSHKNNGATLYSIRPVWRNENLNGGVHTICPHPSGLLFSSGRTLHLHHLDMTEGALVEITHQVLRFPITSIHVAGDRICVTGHTESVSFYSYDKDTKQLNFLKSDTISRNVHHSLLLDNRTVVGVSLSGGMFALKEPIINTRFDNDSLQTLFSFHYPDIIIKPRILSLRGHHATEYLTGILKNHFLPWTMADRDGNDDNVGNHDKKYDHQSEGTLSIAQPIVGCTLSGGMIMAYRCSSSIFSLLRTLQDHLLHYLPTQPLLGSTSQFLSWYTHLSGPENDTIHGDLICAYLRLTPTQQYQVIQNRTNDDGLSLIDLTAAIYPALSVEEDQLSSTAILLSKLLEKMEQYYF